MGTTVTVVGIPVTGVVTLASEIRRSEPNRRWVAADDHHPTHSAHLWRTEPLTAI
jgi:hypothetical protein